MADPLFLHEVRRFENCEYALAEFDHGEHLKVAWTYLQLYGYQAALNRMRAALLRFSAHHSKMGYNETITVFWMRKLKQCNGNFRSMPKQDLFLHYTRERVLSEEAKRQWIEPDLLPI